MQQLLITGANRGIGLEFTQQYLAQGCMFMRLTVSNLARHWPHWPVIS